MAKSSTTSSFRNVVKSADSEDFLDKFSDAPNIRQALEDRLRKRNRDPEFENMWDEAKQSQEKIVLEARAFSQGRCEQSLPTEQTKKPDDQDDCDSSCSESSEKIPTKRSKFHSESNWNTSNNHPKISDAYPKTDSFPRKVSEMVARITLFERVLPPQLTCRGSSTYALHASREIEVSASSTATVPCGVALELPRGFVATVNSYFDLAKVGVITVAHVYDHTWRGELLVVLHNTNRFQGFKVRPNMPVGQMTFQKAFAMKIATRRQLSFSDSFL